MDRNPTSIKFGPFIFLRVVPYVEARIEIPLDNSAFNTYYVLTTDPLT